MTEQSDEVLAEVLRAGRGARFGPGFAARVMQRVEDERANPLAAIMPKELVGLGAAALLIAVALITFSLAGGETQGAQTTVEAIFGLRPLTADTVYDPTALFLSEGASSS